MAASDSIPGTIVQGEAPWWDPLIRVVGHDLVKWFMWMFEVELADGSRLHAYKHVATRRYIHADETGRAFRYDGTGHYEEIAAPVAIARAFVGWMHSSSPNEDVAALRTAMWRARGRGGRD